MAVDLATKTTGLATNSWSWWWEGGTQEAELARAPLTFFLVVITAISLYFWNKKNSPKEVLPPGPRGLPIVGNLPFMDSQLHTYFTNLANIYGPIFKLRMGSKLVIVIGSADLAKEVLKENDATFVNRNVPTAATVVTYGGADVAFAPYGARWRMVRQVCVRQILSKTTLDTVSLQLSRRKQIRRAVKDIYSKIETQIDIGEEMFHTTVNIIINMLWSGTLKDDQGNSTKFGTEYLQVATEVIQVLEQSNISDVFPVLACFDIQGVERQAKQVLSKMDRIFDKIIEQRRKLDNEVTSMYDDVLQSLLQMKEQLDPKYPFTTTNLKALFMNFLIGGTYTSSVTVEWAMAELIKTPENMRKAKEELDAVIGRDKVVEESDLPKLKYIAAIIKETLRLHPGLVPRSPTSSLNIAGYTIPKGTQVFINTWAIQRDPKNWDNPNEFNPERFLMNSTGSNIKGDADFRFLPFGAGRRICVGISIVERTVPYILASLLHSFDWRLPEGTELDFAGKFGTVLKKAKPLLAIPSPRLSDSELYL